MTIGLANAPVSWGVDYAGAPGNPEWQTVMDEIAAAGYRRTELGPYGYYPTDAAILRREFGLRALQPVAGFVFQKLHDPQSEAEVLANAAQTIDLLSKIGAEYLVVIDHISEARMRTAGNCALAEPLDPARYAHMIRMIRTISGRARAKKILPVIHQHAGCYIEFEDEIERVLADLAPEEAALCIDTGHMAYAGIDPVEFYKRHAGRTRYFHFKDIDPVVHARVIAERVPFLDAVAQKIFCPLECGVVDFGAMLLELKATGFSGYATIEQDIDPLVSPRPIDDARRSLMYLRSLGYESTPVAQELDA